MSDLVQVGLTEDANEKLTQLRMDTPYFDEESDVYRCAVAAALALGVNITDAMRRQQFRVKFRTVHDAGEGDSIAARLDSSDRLLAGLVSLHRPEWSKEPYRYSQYLAVIGINYLYRELVEKDMTLYDAIVALQATEDDYRLDDASRGDSGRASD